MVRLDVRNDAFVQGEVALNSQWAAGLTDLIGVLSGQVSVLRLTYHIATEPAALVKSRVNALKTVIEDKWRQSGGNYDLPIEVEIIGK